eukprot:3039812-Rhodomonas_salina.1
MEACAQPDKRSCEQSVRLVYSGLLLHRQRAPDAALYLLWPLHHLRQPRHCLVAVRILHSGPDEAEPSKLLC